ncbi:uncharacterized protein J3D65DRAFT_638431 [Phyllosticta citribraziliensis]|uniref:DUF1772-domain-containing protein n=1 Tax=Phyllosticta citribraziliensis TaxID=989973 RepID=A0ABR1L8W3_9PEZI
MSPPPVALLEPVPVTVRLAQAVGVTVTAFLAGHTASTSYLLTPALLSAPSGTLLARQWRTGYRIAHQIGTPLLAASTALFAWLASREPNGSLPFRLYTTAAVLLLPVQVPFTFIALRKAELQLLGEADHASAASPSASASITASTVDVGREDVALDGVVDAKRNETMHALVDWWATANLGRAGLSIVAAFAGAWATMGRVDVVKYRMW